ncbi:hypothetical protein Avbf_17761 [Armadillidium vulgare]|nr:hypothetical protein Avbf_17761 [Armadillidium vulgare]
MEQMEKTIVFKIEKRENRKEKGVIKKRDIAKESYKRGRREVERVLWTKQDNEEKNDLDFEEIEGILDTGCNKTITMDKLERIKVKCELDSKNHLRIKLIRGLRRYEVFMGMD